MRRTLIIGGSVVLVLLIALGVFIKFGPPSKAGGTTGRTDFFSALFPFGQSGQQNGSSAQSETTTQTNNEKVTTRLRKVSERPVVGFWFAAPIATSSPLRMRFMERGTGHIFETYVDSYTEVRVSNTTIPAVQSVIAISDTDFLMRSFSEDDGLQNFFATVNPTASVQSVSTVALPSFTRVGAEKGSGRILTVTEGQLGSVTTSVKPSGEEKTEILTSPIRSWIPIVAGTKFFLQTAPSFETSGFLYEIKNKALLKVVGGVPGLMSLPSPSGRYILYSGNSRGKISLSLLDTKTGETFLSPLGTLATKCAWVAEEIPTLFCAISNTTGSESLPDDWLIGNVTLNDSAWIVRPTEGVAHALGELEQLANTPMDVLNPAVSSDKKYVLFQNKNDLSLWALDITRDD